MGVRMKDIAEVVGVSPATVSLVLNNKPGAGEELRDRILKTARELGYTAPPRLAARERSASSTSLATDTPSTATTTSFSPNTSRD